MQAATGNRVSAIPGFPMNLGGSQNLSLGGLFAGSANSTAMSVPNGGGQLTNSPTPVALGETDGQANNLATTFPIFASNADYNPAMFQHGQFVFSLGGKPNYYTLPQINNLLMRAQFLRDGPAAPPPATQLLGKNQQEIDKILLKEPLYKVEHAAHLFKYLGPLVLSPGATQKNAYADRAWAVGAVGRVTRVPYMAEKLSVYDRIGLVISWTDTAQYPMRNSADWVMSGVKSPAFAYQAKVVNLGKQLAKVHPAAGNYVQAVQQPDGSTRYETPITIQIGTVVRIDDNNKPPPAQLIDEARRSAAAFSQLSNTATVTIDLGKRAPAVLSAKDQNKLVREFLEGGSAVQWRIKQLMQSAR